MVGDRGGRQADAVEKSGAGADDHLVERKMLHPELLHEVCGFPGQRRPRLRGGSVEFGLKRRLVGLKDGGAEGKQLLVSLEIDLRRKLRAAVERERDQMPQRLRLRKYLGLLLGDQMIKRPDQPVVIRRVVLEKRLEKLRVLLQLRQNRLLHRLHRCNERRKRLKRDTVFRRKTLPCPAPTAPARSSLRANRALAL